MDTHTPTKELLGGIFNIFKTLVRKFKTPIILVACLVGTFLFWNGVIVAVDSRLEWKHQAVEIMRDATVVVIADRMAGESTPVESLNIDENGAIPYPIELTWGIETNSLWLVKMTRYIIPYMSYEKLVGTPNTPEIILFAPKLADDSFHLMGTAGLSLIWGDVVVLNERMLYQDEWDAERLLSVLVHELVHLQGGAFRNGESEDLEAATQAATIEVLAGMCNHGYDLACKTFWAEIEDLAQMSLRTKLKDDNLSWVYELFCNLFIRNRMERQLSRKADRHWQDDPEYLAEIVKKYGAKPWLDHVVPGVLGKPMRTSAPNAYSLFWHIFREPMPFDDTIELLGPVRYVIAFFQYFRLENWYGEL